MNDIAFQALAGMGGALGAAVPEHAEWQWDQSARIALVVLTVEEAEAVYTGLSEACDQDWTVANIGDCNEAVATMLQEMGGLRSGQHFFCSAMGQGDFVYLAAWPWNDQVHVSIRFGTFYATGTHDDSAVHSGVIKRGLGIGNP